MSLSLLESLWPETEQQLAGKLDERPVKIRLEGVGKNFLLRADVRENGERALEFVAVDEIELDVHQGEFLVVVGPSGCGKSTLLDLLAGLSQPTRGRILLDGTPIHGPGPDRGVVFQQYALLPWRTVLQNIEFGLEARNIPERERKRIARENLELVGLEEFGDRYPSQLSGGMKQRAAIARSLAVDPDVLLMDEPFAALDAQTRENLQEELLRIWRKTGKTIVFITHGIDEAVVLGQRVAVMSSRPGRIKRIVDVPESLHRTGIDARSLPEFGRIRHEIWSLLHNEVPGIPDNSSPTRPLTADNPAILDPLEIVAHVH